MPIVALTANALKGEAEHCRAVGMDDYRSKPSPLAELKAVLEKWLPLNPAEPGETASLTPSTLLSQPGAQPAPVDVNVLQALVGDDPNMIREFLQHFRNSAAAIAVELRAACAASQTKAAADAAHKLKSSARAIGAFALADLCATMEKKGNGSDGDALVRLLPRFNAEMTAVEAFLSSPPKGDA
jgi:two-component system sensor histidine kinase/response regulator